MAHVKSLFELRRWHELVPDQKHQVLTDGYGTFDASTTPGSRYVMTSDYVTTAATPDGKLVIAYFPSRRTVTIDMTRLAAPATARWYDPVGGTYTNIPASPLANRGKHTFTPPANNADGDGDWVLILETEPPANNAGGNQ